MIIIPLLVSVAFFTLAEWKILGSVQRRRGPNVVGTYGLLQPLSDGLKLFLKEGVIPNSADSYIFIFSPIITFSLSLLGWAVVPYNKYAVLSDISLGMLYFFAISSLGVYGIILSGWSSNSKYSFLGCLRSTSQMVSYEVSIGFIISSICLCVGSFNLNQIIYSQLRIWFVIPFFPLFLMFFVSCLAETNRHPFDLPEAEAELVSGYNVEYSSMSFALFSLGEYSSMLLMSSVCSILFFGGWLSPFFNKILSSSIWFSMKVCFFVILFIVSWAALPWYRYDQLMNIGWKVFLPLSIAYLVFIAMFLICFSGMPY